MPPTGAGTAFGTAATDEVPGDVAFGAAPGAGAAICRGVVGEKRGAVPVVDLPLIPQQNQREAKYHPQNGAADVVHENLLLTRAAAAATLRPKE